MARTTEYRRKLKATNPQKYAEYLQKQKERSRASRQKLKEMAKTSKAALQKLNNAKKQSYSRVKSFRDKNRKNMQSTIRVKFSPQCCSTTSPFSTRSAVNCRRAYWREYKQTYRAHLGPQKARAIRQKDAAAKRAKRMALKQKRLTVQATGFKSKKTMKNVTSTVRRILPTDAKQYAAVVDNLVNRCSPSKRQAMDDLADGPVRKYRRVVQVQHVRRSFQSMPTQAAKAAALVLQKYASQRAVAKTLSLNRKTVSRAVRVGLKRHPRKKLNTAMVHSFYKRPDISRQMPGKRYARKEGPGFLMQLSLKAAFAIFKKEFPSAKLGFTKFCLLRPKNVRLISMSHREYCVCIYCLNIKYKLLAINRVVPPEKRIQDEYGLMTMLLCPVSDGSRFHAPECVTGTCKRCQNYKETMRQYYNEIDQTQTSCTWNHWERQIQGDGKCRRTIVTKKSSVEQLLDEFMADVCYPCQGTTFVSHIFTALWQYKQYSNLKENLPEGWVLSVVDFAKNRSIMFQDEIKEAFFAQQQITVFPVVMYYKNLQHELVRDVLVCLSDDRSHDYHVVNHFCRLADDYLKEMGFDILNKVMFSDGCSSQFKGYGSFGDLSLSSHPTNRNYYGSEHGKGESDGEMGVLNRALDRAIVTRKAVLRDAEETYKFCQENLELNDECQKRHFVFVRSNDIKRDRPYTNVRTLAGTRKIHQAVRIAPYKLKVRSLSCFCHSCRNLNASGKCINKDYVGPLVLRSLTLQPCEVEVEVALDEDLQDISVTDLLDPDGVPLDNIPMDELDVPVDEPGVPVDEPGVPVDEPGVPVDEPGVAVDEPGVLHSPHDDINTDNPSSSSKGCNPRFHQGQFVLVQLGEKKKKDFAAEVLSITEDGSLWLKYMVRNNNGLYSWPLEDDVSCEPASCIKRSLNIPHLVTEKSSSRKMYFSFKELN